jgi:hypothetical protein
MSPVVAQPAVPLAEAACRTPLVLRVSHASNMMQHARRVAARRLFHLFLVKIVPSIAVIASSLNALFELHEKKHAVMVAATTMEVEIAVVVGAVGAIAVTAMNDANAGKFFFLKK